MKWLIHSLLALFIVIFSTAFAAVDSPRTLVDDMGNVREVDSLSPSRRHIEATKRLTIWGDTLGAERIWRGIIEQDSLYAPALYALAGLDHIETTEAVHYAAKAYAADTMNKWYGQRYGSMLLEVEDYNRALNVYKNLMHLDSRDVATYYYLSNIYNIKHMPYSAIAILDSAEIRLGHNPYLAGLKQSLLFRTRQYDRAISEGIKITEESPYDIEAHLSLARAYQAAGRDSMARASYELAFAIDTTNIGTLQELWDFYLDIDDIDGVFRLEERFLEDSRIAEGDKVQRVERFTTNEDVYNEYFHRIGKLIYKLSLLYPTNRDVVHLYTKHLYYSGQPAVAAEYLSGHLSDSNVTPDDYILALELARAMQDGMVMVDLLYNALDVYPDNVFFISLAAGTVKNMGLTNDAIKMVKRSLKLVKSDEDRSTLWCTIADMYYDEGKVNSAFKAYQKSLDYNPENPAALNNYAYYMSLTGKNLSKALSMAMLAVTLDDNNYNYIDSYAWILHLLGRNTEAKKYMMQALSLSRQQDANLLVHYADILWDLGEKFMADTYWKKAESLGYDKDLLRTHIQTKKMQIK